jgi:3-methyladenine DNA glycosylase AlkD
MTSQERMRGPNSRQQPSLTDLAADIAALSSAERAQKNAWFFKTGPGQYGEGDQFAGLTLTQVHTLRKKYRDLSLNDVEQFLHSSVHEERLIALDILVDQFKRADSVGRERIFNLYVGNTAFVNNWDLVDASAGHIVGAYLQDKPKDVLDHLASSGSVWDRRIAMIATFPYIKQGDSEVALRVAEMLVYDKHDLIHKAVGWMLREVGKRERLTNFLDKYAATMPRTMLRYSLELLPPTERQYYMALKGQDAAGRTRTAPRGNADLQVI